MSQIAGKYNVVKEIGEGSTGKVLLVRHSELGTEYALKLLDRSLSMDQKFIDRFKREADILLKFNHPGSVQLRDFGKTEDGLFYMAMDFCPGNSLKEILEKIKRLPVNRALQVTADVLEVLGEAHALGIIHRDIKPDNIMVETDASGKDRIRILDFGIAKIREGGALTSTVTMEGASIGTPQYMSPEQAAGEKELDHRLDIYSAGILLYELLAGYPPFRGKTVLHTLLMQLTHPTPGFAPELGIPTEVEQIVKTALEKEREKRFQDTVSFKEACLEALKNYKAGVAEAPKLAEVPSKEEAPKWEIQGGIESKKILCLDDQEMIVNIMKHILEKEGYTVQTSTDWSLIHAFLFSQKVDLFITDVEMPGLRGTAICQILKQTTPDLKICLFSNIPERDLEKFAKECKADAWISKNWSPTEWVSRIKEILAA